MDGGAAAQPAAQHVAPAPAAHPTGVKTLMNIALYLTDAVMLVGAFVAGYYARLYLPFFARPDVAPALREYAGVLVMHVASIMMVFYLSRMYHMPRMVSRIDTIRNIVAMVTVGTVLAFGASALLFEDTPLSVDYPQTLFFYVTVFSILATAVGRHVYLSTKLWMRHTKVDVDNLLIVGGGSVAYDIALRIKQNPALGYNIIGMVTKEGLDTDSLPGVGVIGSYADLTHIIDQHQIEQVIIALPDANRVELVELISRCQRGRVDVKVYPDMLAYMSGDMNMDDLGGTPLITVRDIALRGWRLSLKRGLDIVGAFLGLIFLSPFMLLTALIIRLESHGPVFYTQERMGLDGKPFEMIKFRSMRIDAETAGPGWTVPGDTRVTRFGKFLRSSNWDEIPQLINVLLGEMSLVGPRPERPVYVEQFQANIPRYMERHREKAGMTGWAQVNGLRGDTSIAERTTYDLWYVENWSLWLDIKIIIRTVLMTVSRRSPNAY